MSSGVPAASTVGLNVFVTRNCAPTRAVIVSTAICSSPVFVSSSETASFCATVSLSVPVEYARPSRMAAALSAVRVVATSALSSAVRTFWMCWLATVGLLYGTADHG
jgi:hypothetical protein